MQTLNPLQTIGIFGPCVVAVHYCGLKQLSLKKTWRACSENVAQLNPGIFGTGADTATQHGADKPQGNQISRKDPARVTRLRDALLSLISCLMRYF